MKFEHMEVFRTEGTCFTVIVDGRFASMLTVDEALGVMASALFCERPMFVKSYEAWAAREEILSKYGKTHKTPVALLTTQKEYNMKAIPKWGIRAHGDNMEILNAIRSSEVWTEAFLDSRMMDDEEDPDSTVFCQFPVEDLDEFTELFHALIGTQARLSLFVDIEHDHANAWATLADFRDTTAEIKLKPEARSSDIEKAASEAVSLINSAIHKHKGLEGY